MLSCDNWRVWSVNAFSEKYKKKQEKKISEHPLEWWIMTLLHNQTHIIFLYFDVCWCTVRVHWTLLFSLTETANKICSVAMQLNSTVVESFFHNDDDDLFKINVRLIAFVNSLNAIYFYNNQTCISRFWFLKINMQALDLTRWPDITWIKIL